MGLFNYVRVEQELALDATLKVLNHNWRDEEYQTKELEDNVMATYILRDNKLFEEITEGHHEPKSKEELEEDKKIYGKRFSSIWKDKFVVDKKYEKFRNDYTGTFVFGCVVNGETIDSTDFYPDWKAVVVEGIVKELTILPEYTKFSSKDRIENQRKFDEELETHRRKMKCPVYNFYYTYYVQVVEKFSWKFQRLISKVIRGLDWVNYRGVRLLVKALTPR